MRCPLCTVYKASNRIMHMKLLLFFTAVITLTSGACKKSGSSARVFTSLDGKWTMIIVKDNASGAATTKPSSIQKDVEITFSQAAATTGTFSGQTPTNDILQNDYSTGVNQTLEIPALSMTKVAETAWGILFVDHIRAAQEYTFEFNGALFIKTVNKTLIFQKS